MALYGTVNPPDHTHSVGELRGVEGEPLQGPPGKDGVDGKDGKDGAPGRDGTDGTNAGIGPQGPQGLQGKPGANGTDGENGKDAVLPEGLVTIETPQGTLFGAPTSGTVYRLVSGVSQVNFSNGHGAFALPQGTLGIASFHATLIGSGQSVGVVSPTDASAIGLVASENGSQEVAYLALIW